MVRLERDTFWVSDSPELQLELSAVFYNTTEHTVYLFRNAALERLEKHEQDEWRVALHPIRTLALHQPTSVAPTESIVLVDQISLSRGVHPAVTSMDVPGTYRAIYSIYRSWDLQNSVSLPGELLPSELRTSMPFEIRLRERVSRE